MPYKDKKKKKEYHKKYGKQYRADGRVDLERSREISKAWRRNNPQGKYLSGIRSRAKRLGLEFNLTKEDIIIPDVCPVLNIPIIITEGKQTRNTPAADRVDNTKGYVKGNVRIISHKANRMKADMSIEDVERLLAYMKGEI